MTDQEQTERGASTVDRVQATSDRLYKADFFGRNYLADYVADVQTLCADLERVTAELATTELVFRNLQLRCEEVEMRHGDLLRANAALKANQERLLADLEEMQTLRARLKQANERIAEFEAAEVGTLRSLIESHFDSARGEWSCVAERDAMREQRERLRDYVVSTPCWLCTLIDPLRRGVNCGQCEKAREALAPLASLDATRKATADAAEEGK